jgi:hypothetical protein
MPESLSYNRVQTGELAGSATALQLPDIACKLVCFKALSDNVGKVYLGAAGVTVKNGVTDVTTGYELGASESTPWIPIDNLSRLFRICNNAGDTLTYIALG